MPSDMTINVSYSEAQVDAVAQMMAGIPGGYEKVTMGAMNRVLRTMRGRAATRLAAAGGYKKSIVLKHSHVAKAHRTYVSGLVRGSIRFGGTFWAIDQAARQTRKGVTMTGPGGKRFLIPHAFIATMPHFKRQVYTRARKDSVGYAAVPAHEWAEESGELVGRLPVRPLKGTPIFTLWQANAALRAEIEEDAGERLKVETEAYMKHLLDRWGGYTGKAPGIGAVDWNAPIGEW